MTHSDPVLNKLAEILKKQDETIFLQEKMDNRLDEIVTDCKKLSRTHGAIAGGLSGGLVSVSIALIRAKLGI